MCLRLQSRGCFGCCRRNNTEAHGACVQKKAAPAGEKPEPVRTHLRDVIVLPEMIGSLVGVYNGKTFNQVEIKVRALRLDSPTRAAVLDRACRSLCSAA